MNKPRVATGKTSSSVTRRKKSVANSSNIIVKHDKGVDFKPGDLNLINKAVRPSKYKAKKIFRGRIALELDWHSVTPPDNTKRSKQTNPEFEIIVAPIHRLEKSDFSYFEQRQSYKINKKSVSFSNLPRAHYMVLIMAKGHRPYIDIVNFSQKTQTSKIVMPLIPVRQDIEERVLIFHKEVHPFITQTRKYMRKFGYFKATECKCEEDELCEHLSKALELFQHNYRMEKLGSLSVETFLLMLKPRCPIADLIDEDSAQAASGPGGVGGSDPIAFSDNHWDNHNLNYRFLTGTGDISNEQSIIRGALDTWAAKSPLSFTETTSTSSDLEFDFRSPSEATYPFDRGGDKNYNTYAHAFFPFNGLVEFDEFEDWGSSGLLRRTTTHEIGHALGLRHSSVGSASMYPYDHSDWDQLHEVDIKGIKSLYTPVYLNTSNFIRYPLYSFDGRGGTDSITIDLGSTKRFLAWGVITSIDSLANFDRDNMCHVDIFEVDGNRTGWRVSGGDHFGSSNSPANVYEAAYVGSGQTIMFRLCAGHPSDLEVSGYALVLILDI